MNITLLPVAWIIIIFHNFLTLNFLCHCLTVHINRLNINYNNLPAVLLTVEGDTETTTSKCFYLMTLLIMCVCSSNDEWLVDRVICVCFCPSKVIQYQSFIVKHLSTFPWFDHLFLAFCLCFLKLLVSLTFKSNFNKSFFFFACYGLFSMV